MHDLNKIMSADLVSPMWCGAGRSRQLVLAEHDRSGVWRQKSHV